MLASFLGLGAAKPVGTLFLLTGAYFADTGQTFPVRLYTVSASHKLRLFRTVVSGGAGTSGILDDTRDKIYVTFPSNNGVSRAPRKVSVIHQEYPQESDVVTFNPQSKFTWPYASATAAGPRGGSYALFTLFPQPPPTVNGHVAFMRFIHSSATTLVAVAGDAPASGPRVTANDWSLYSRLSFSGTPGGPNSYFPREAAVEGGDVVMRFGGKATVVDRAPPALARAASGKGIRIVAANQRFVVTWLWRAGDRSTRSVFYVHDRQLGRWRDLKFSWNQPQSRIFGPWLATIAMSYEGIGGGVWDDPNPGHSDESNHWVKGLLPDVRLEFEDTSIGERIPGLLILDNLVDGRRITVDTREEDSEILDVRSDGLVLYRVNDEIFSAQIQGDKLSAPTLVVKGEDVPEVHWAFWSNAPAKPTPSAKPSAKR